MMFNRSPTRLLSTALHTPALWLRSTQSVLTISKLAYTSSASNLFLSTSRDTSMHVYSLDYKGVGIIKNNSAWCISRTGSSCPKRFSSSVKEDGAVESMSCVEKVEKSIKQTTKANVFAVVHVKGSQYKVTVDDSIVIAHTHNMKLGEEIYLHKVLCVGSPDFTLFGTPVLDSKNVIVKAVPVEHTQTPKMISFKFQRRKRYQRKKGHRRKITILRIRDIIVKPGL